MTSFLLFKEQKTVAEIASERNLALSTILGHLAYFVGIGELDVSEVVTPEKLLFIKDVVATTGRMSIK